jgi:hypothetical protein
MNLRHLSAAIAAASAVVLSGGAATASAEPVTIGPPDLTIDTWSMGLSGDTIVNRQMPAGVSNVAPRDGRLVRWRVNAASTGPLRMIVVRPTGPMAFTVVGTDDVTVPAAGVNTFTPAAPIALAAGDSVGLVDQGPGGAKPRAASFSGPETFTVKPQGVAPANPATGEAFAGVAAPVGMMLLNADVDDVIAATPASPEPPAPAVVAAPPVAEAPQPAAAPQTPVAATCSSRRAVTITWALPAGRRARRIHVTLDGRPLATLGGGARRFTVSLKGRAKQTSTVRIRAAMADGTLRSTTRRYRTCTPRVDRAARPSLLLRRAA